MTYRAACSLGINALILSRTSWQARASALGTDAPCPQLPSSSAKNAASVRKFPIDVSSSTVGAEVIEEVCAGCDTVYLTSRRRGASPGAKSLIELPPSANPRAAESTNPERPRKVRAQAAFIGTAGWNVPAQYAAGFLSAGTHLERYATRLNAVEINSSFYRPHRRQTYERWAGNVPEHFRFAVKIPREITHECCLLQSEEELDRFASEVAGLGANLGVLLVQLPPSLVFDADGAIAFFADVRTHFGSGVGVACEPRHRSWFSEGANAVLQAYEVARVAADPPRCDEAHQPGGWSGLRYHRLHGSPRMYYSTYDDQALERTRRDLERSIARAAATWCIFDNTAAHAALGNALAVQAVPSIL